MDFISTSASGDDDVSPRKAPETTPKPLPKLDTADGRAEILRRANDGEKDALRLVGPTLDRDRREGGDLVNDYGDMFRYACLAMALVATDEREPYFTATIEKVEALSDGACRSQTDASGAYSLRAGRVDVARHVQRRDELL